MIEITNKRLIALDTETTGLETQEGHRIIEIGGVEIKQRVVTNSEYHQYIQPNRKVEDSVKIHGISDKFLIKKPLFSEIAQALIDYIKGSTLIIHNAAFDVGFLNHEFALMGLKTRVEDICSVIDTIDISKEINPRSRHSLDALARKYNIDLTKRSLHGALLDAQILAQVYLTMTGGQRMMFADFGSQGDKEYEQTLSKQPINPNREKIVIIEPSAEELLAHEQYFETFA